MEVLAPIDGTTVALADVPDPVFAQQIVGSGIAIRPKAELDRATAIAPISGKVLKVLPHAFVIAGEGGKGVLVHIGIDTVRMEGEDAFRIHVENKQQVSAGDLMITFNPKAVTSAGYDPICPVVIMDSAANSIDAEADRLVEAGDLLFTVD